MIKRRLSKNKGFVKVDLTTMVIWAIVSIAALIMTVVFALTLYTNFKESRIISNLEDASEEISQQVQENFQNLNATVNSAISKIIANTKNISEKKLIATIKSQIPNTTRVFVSNKNLKKIKPQPYPAINYATLDMLKLAKKTNKDPVAEIHLFGQKDQYINYVHILNNERDLYLVISLPANLILKGLKEPDFSFGNVIVTQSAGKYSLVNLKLWGKVAQSNSSIKKVIDIPNSYFQVQYSYEPLFYFLRGMTTFSSLIGFLSSLLLFAGVVMNVLKKAKEFKQEKAQTKTYVHIPKPGEITHADENDEQTTAQDGEQPPPIKKRLKLDQDFVLDKSMFRAYDIRGIVDQGLTSEAVKLIGQAIGTENKKRGKSSIVVARDGRLSGPLLLQALTQGILASGCDVINIGAVPTGVLYFATHHLSIGSGVMLTGSHNPPDYNGLKIMLDGETLAGKLIMDLYDAIMAGELDEGEGDEQEMDIVDDYVDHIASDIQLENELKVVVDCGNGIGGEVGPMVLEEIGCEVLPLHCEVDGNFPNHHPDPSVPANLEDLIMSVKAADADIGIAFDGDADRLGVVTKKGEMIYPDRLLMLFAQDVLTRQPGASIIFDVKCTGHLPKEIVKSGGLPIIWKTGHSFMKAKIKETNAALAGEMSGHFFFNERWFGFDDGIYAAARLLEIIDQEDRPAQEIFDELPNSVSTPELKCQTKEGENYAFMEKFQQAADFPDANITTIDGIRADFADGWGLVRCSNTTPCLVMRFDANNEAALERIKSEFKKQILAIDANLDLPF